MNDKKDVKDSDKIKIATDKIVSSLTKLKTAGPVNQT